MLTMMQEDRICVDKTGGNTRESVGIRSWASAATVRKGYPQLNGTAGLFLPSCTRIGSPASRGPLSRRRTQPARDGYSSHAPLMPSRRVNSVLNGMAEMSFRLGPQA